MSSYSATAATRRGSVVPPLSGIESNGAQNPIPQKCDVLISGTGLVESILAAALAWQGSSVIHIDPNPYYGDSNSCFNIDQLLAWVDRVNRPPSSSELAAERIFSNARLYMPRPLDSKKFLVDLSPKIMFARSDLLSLLIKSRVFRYLEFKALGNFHTYENDTFDKVAGSKEDIFTDQSLSLVTKRNLMRFMKFVLEWEENTELWKPYQNESIEKFLTEKFKLEPQQITELVLSIGLCQSLEVATPVALSRIKRYLVSLDIYGNFPVLFSMYGGAGELAQGFCRSAAVAGATYKLGTAITSVDDKLVTLNDGSRIQVAEKIVLSPSSAVKKENTKNGILTRLVAFVAKDCKEWFAENEQAALVVFPPSTLSTNNKTSVQAIILGSGSGQCPEGVSVWYLSSTEQDPTKAQRDLEEAFTKLEASILRESTEDFEFENIDESDVSYRPDGMPVLSSVKLGQSMQNFVPREKLQYLLKLSFVEKVEYSAQPDAPILPEETPEASPATVLRAPYGLSEISYDGILTQVKNLYTKIVGSDDDFFDVDFEDEDEASAGANQTNSSAPNAIDASTVNQIDSRDDDIDEFGQDMEL
ncbi:Mrs6p [Sugiyamaella lignohabitans]|uniref:Rab proteins geranylgeranyltransferase n=1 Tax=Sugiyamaella lignohabitans TaxID=796027 RepID=A0A167DQ00_9ASCO|nr:Mrs6p [Sugiyamaella lignohabitans]ANB13154.1 Mrs6p [Sugiyamaella lignohabitans]